MFVIGGQILCDILMGYTRDLLSQGHFYLVWIFPIHRPIRPIYQQVIHISPILELFYCEIHQI